MFFRKKSGKKGSKKKKGKKDSKSKKNPQEEFDKSWEMLRMGIYHLVDFLESTKTKPFDFDEYSKLYSIVYNLCTQKVNTGKLGGGPTELLYDRFHQSMSEYLETRVVPPLREVGKEELLSEAVKRWRDHQIVVKYMRKVFDYLDRYYTKHNNRDSLRKVGLKVYQVLVYGKIKKNMAAALLEQIHIERNGELIDRSAMHDGISLFIEMGLKTDGKDNLEKYKEDFEKALIKDTIDYYRKQSQIWIQENDCPGYMKCAETKLNEELNRANHYLHSTTETVLMKTVEREVITQHAKLLLTMENSGFIPLMKDLEEKRDDLWRMYRLFKRVNHLEEMADMMREFIKDEGMSILQKHEAASDINVISYIEALLESHEKFLRLVNEQFHQDPLFKERLKDAFTHFVNTDLTNKKKKSKTSTAELLSKYCDNVMKTTDKIGEENLDPLLDKIVRLFGYISDKDMFQEFYRRLLSKRLLMGSRTNDDAERSFIAKLKMKCGASFTSKLEGMIKDKSLSSDLQKEFKTFSKERQEKMHKIDFTPTVLTTGFWPSFKIDQLTVPQDIIGCIQVFQEYYDKKTESRSLTWVHSLGQCQVQALFKSGKKILLCSTYQACILLLFNQEGQTHKAIDMQKALGISFDDIRKNLLSLCVSKKAKILNKISGNPKKKNVQQEDEFGVNANFRSKTARIKIPNLVLKISKEEKKNIQETTKDDRKYAIDAAIVRIMKARKTMEHQQLVLEVTRQMMSHFRPDPKLIKRRIEDLITREYLERSDERASLYRYLA